MTTRLLLLLALLTASCVVGIAPSPTPAPTLTHTATEPPVLPTLTTTATNTATPTLAATRTVTPGATPTAEEPVCNPRYSAYIFTGEAWVYANPGLTVRMVDEKGNTVILKRYREVLLLETSEYGYRVVTRYGERVDGWVAYYTLPVECR